MNERQRFPEGWKPSDGGYIMGRPMMDGRWWVLLPLTLGRLRIVIAEDQFTAGEHWCFPEGVKGYQDALTSYESGIPKGWTRHMLPDGTFERQEADNG